VSGEQATTADAAPRNRTSASWLRAQLLSLQTALAIGADRLETADICRALAAIARGAEWREAVRR
jgi:hypothetical protein